MEFHDGNKTSISFQATEHAREINISWQITYLLFL